MVSGAGLSTESGIPDYRTSEMQRKIINPIKHHGACVCVCVWLSSVCACVARARACALVRFCYVFKVVLLSFSLPAHTHSTPNLQSLSGTPRHGSGTGHVVR